MVPNIWIFALEPLDGRYTKQWHENLPTILQEAAGDNYNVRQIDGIQRNAKLTPGAFLNFTDTNYWKSSQLCNFIELYDAGETTINDKFLFTDFWNPVITQVKYMNDLMDQDWELHSIVHAGAYDPSDILGYKMQKPWPWDAERSWFHSSDYNYYATNSHRDMFLKNLDIPVKYHHKAIRSGQPHELIVKDLVAYQDTPKQDTVMWPHRYNADKQPLIAEDLSDNFDMVITQKMNLDKADYYAKMGTSKAIFSCALHENLGISVMEAVLTGAIPIVPDRCSYTEMYHDEFKYPSKWTQDMPSYVKHKDKLIRFIDDRLTRYSAYKDLLTAQQERLKREYLTSNIMMENILKHT